MADCEEQISLAEDIYASSNNIKYHTTIVKWIGVMMLLTVSVTVPIIVIIARGYPSTCHTSEPDVTESRTVNMSTCSYVKQFHLSHQTYATVCSINGHIIVDLRHFVNHTATVKGIGLDIMQWMTLKQHISTVDSSIREARTYWKNIKRMKTIQGNNINQQTTVLSNLKIY